MFSLYVQFAVLCGSVVCTGAALALVPIHFAARVGYGQLRTLEPFFTNQDRKWS
jgi:hypothetical protein